MSPEALFPEPLRELQYALAEGNSQAPPAGARQRAVAAALAARPPGRPVDQPPAITAVEAYRRTVANIGSVLEGLSAAQWCRPALRGLSVQGLVGHLTGVELQFLAQLGPFADAGASVPTPGDHIASTQSTALAQAGRPPTDTYRDWAASTAATLHSLAEIDSGCLVRPIDFYGATLPLDKMLVVRAFEMWVHEEDIRGAAGFPLEAPEPARLALMTELAVALLPAGMLRAERARPGRTFRLVLTGPGGGTWSVPDQGAAEARLVVDAVAFCRVVANRLEPDDAHVIVSGDAALASDVLVGAAALALD